MHYRLPCRKASKNPITERYHRHGIFSNHESGNIDKKHQGNMKAITQIDEMGLLAGSSDVDGTAVEHGIVGYDPNHPSIHPGETRNDSLAATGLNPKYRPFVNDHADQLAHVVRLAAIERNDRRSEEHTS